MSSEVSYLSKSQIKEFKTVLESIRNERRKYIESEKILKNILIEITEDCSSIDSLLRQKVRDIILRQDIINCLKINNEKNKVSLLDNTNFLNVELTYEEQKQLRNILEERLYRKQQLLLDDINEISDIHVQEAQELIERFKFNPHEESNKVLEEETKLKELREKLFKIILELGDKLNALLDLKNEVVPKMMENKTEQLILEQEKISARLKINEIKNEIQLFNDSPMSLRAYHLIYKDMKEQQESYAREIDSLNSDIEKFTSLLKNKEYEEIWQDYIKYVKGIEKYKWLNNL